MRFGKRTKNWAAAGRRLLGDRRENEPGAVATEERNALLEPDPEETPMTPPPDEAPLIAGDPTQRLLTALGRFQRQVSRAETAPNHPGWSDECMDQLITGIEIALEQGWDNVKEALTDTARVLQTYEDSGMAAQSLPFLQDSYEILCLMVGDLIVDNVRSGVMKKWRDRYEYAVEDLMKAGLTLVDDEQSAGRPEAYAEPRQEWAGESVQDPFGEPEPEDLTPPDRCRIA